VLTCPHCAGEVPAGTIVCPECGRELQPRDPVTPAAPSGARVAGGLGCVILGALLGLLGIVLLFGMIAGGMLG
jgi:hypothetical protein